MSSKGRYIKGRFANMLSDFKIQEDHESSRSLSETCSEETMERKPDKMTDIERAIYNTSKLSASFNKQLSIRHLLTLAVGGAIGTGMFINTGSSLSTGGPASLLIAWTIISTCLFTIVNALGELSAAFPVVGGFNVYVTRFVEPSFGFAVNLTYLAQWAVLLPLQLVAASITIRYWNKDVNADIWVAIFYVCIFLANLLDVKSFGETEFVLSMVKILAIVGFTILGIILICGGGPEGGYIGAKYWHEPGPFVESSPGGRLKGICSVFVTAAFSYSGTELVAVSAAESMNAHRTMPKAAKRTFWLITISYLAILTIIGCLVSSKDSRLLSNSSSVDVTASPMVIAIENGGINGLPSLMNAIILIAILSVANSSVYACSRCMVPMAEIGNLPRCLTYVDRKGRPIVAILVTLFIGLLSFIAASEKRQEVFTWLSALSGLSSLFCWFAINLSHIRFRYAFKANGRSLEELPYVSMTGILGSYYGCIMITVVLVASFYTSLFPVGSGSADMRSFFEGYLSMPIFLLCYVGHKIYKKSWKLFIRSGDIDVDSGRRHYTLEELQAKKELEREELQKKSLLMRFIDLWC